MNILHAIRKATLTAEEMRIVGECMPRESLPGETLQRGLLECLGRERRHGYHWDAEPAESARRKLAPLIGAV